MDNLIWKEIPNYNSRYYISTEGFVKTYKGNILKPVITENGYTIVHLRNKGETGKTHRLHKLVADAFLPNDSNVSDINHLNGIKTDNRLCNLERCNRSENMLHAFRLGLVKLRTKENHLKAKLTQVKANEIRNKFITGKYSLYALGKEYNVHAKTISQIVNGKSWVT